MWLLKELYHPDIKSAKCITKAFWRSVAKALVFLKFSDYLRTLMLRHYIECCDDYFYCFTWYDFCLKHFSKRICAVVTILRSRPVQWCINIFTGSDQSTCADECKDPGIFRIIHSLKIAHGKATFDRISHLAFCDAKIHLIQRRLKCCLLLFATLLICALHGWNQCNP